MYTSNFLENLFNQRQYFRYARITKLNLYEQPVEEITGRIQSGNINIDGSSNVRRTCSLSILVKDKVINYSMALSTKFKLEVGVANNIDIYNPKIVWFNQGIFITTGFNGTQESTGYRISLTGKDKMCLLNGESGGTFYGQVELDKLYEYDENGELTIRKLPIEDIIVNMLEQYGNEARYNIVIKDLKDSALQALKYRGKENLFALRQENNNLYTQIKTGSFQCYIADSQGNKQQITLNTLQDDECESLNPFHLTDPVVIYLNAADTQGYVAAKIKYNSQAGFEIKDLFYPKDLIAEVGSTITQALDKITSLLQIYEYFYDIDGHFTFQVKPLENGNNVLNLPFYDNDTDNIYLNKSLSQLSEVKRTLEIKAQETSLSVSPDLDNIKNDFSIWGEKTLADGVTQTFHVRYALDKKPLYYKTLQLTEQDCKVFNQLTGESIEPEAYIKDSRFYCVNGYPEVPEGEEAVYCDWRELIYQMAIDWDRGHYLDDFYARLQENNSYFFNGRSGYEPFYADLLSFWRDLYTPNPEISLVPLLQSDLDRERTSDGYKYYYLNKLIGSQITFNNQNIIILDYQKDGFSIGDTTLKVLEDGTYEIVYSENGDTINLPNFIYTQDGQPIFKAIGIYNEKASKWEWYYQTSKLDGQLYKREDYTFTEIEEFNFDDDIYVKSDNIYFYSSEYYNPQTGFAKVIESNPESLTFWFDFIEINDSILEDFSVHKIGDRIFSEFNKDLTGLYHLDTPDLIYLFGDSGSQEEVDKLQYDFQGYSFITLEENKQNYFPRAETQNYSALDRVKALFTSKVQCSEVVNISMIPHLDLQENDVIKLVNEELDMNDNFIIQRISLPLNYNGLMQITALKIPSNII